MSPLSYKCAHTCRKTHRHTHISCLISETPQPPQIILFPAFQSVPNCSFWASQNGGWAEPPRRKWILVCCTARVTEVPDPPARSGEGDGLVPDQSGGDRALCSTGEGTVTAAVRRCRRCCLGSRGFRAWSGCQGHVYSLWGVNEYLLPLLFIYTLSTKFWWLFYLLKSKYKYYRLLRGWPRAFMTRVARHWRWRRAAVENV